MGSIANKVLVVQVGNVLVATVYQIEEVNGFRERSIYSKR